MDSVDDFLASLDQFTSPTIDLGIAQLGQSASPPTTLSSNPPLSTRSGHDHACSTQAASSRVALQGHKRPRSDGAVSAGSGNEAATPGLPGTVLPTLQSSSGPHSSRSSGAAGGDPAGGGGGSITWACARCTLVNAAAARECAACLGLRELPPQAPEVVAQRYCCPLCTYLNAPTHRRCEMCNSALPQSSTTTTAGVAAAPAASAGQDESEVEVVSSSSDDDDDEDEEDGGSDDDEGDYTDSGDESDDSRTVGHSGISYDVLDNRELVRFLQTLDAVPFDQLPEASVPATVVERGQLRPFQLQALHWLLLREGHRQQSPQHSVQETLRQPGDSGLLLSCDNDLTDVDATEMASPGDGVTSYDMQTVRGGVFADYMGLGKTRTLIALCEATRGPRYDRVTGSQVASPATLIVCPTALITQWAEEIRSCVTPAPRVLMYYGSQKRRLTLFQVAQNYDYVLCSYQSLCHEPSVSSSSPGKMYMIWWSRVILDEAHYIRNMRTHQSRACLRLSATYKWAVTATPVQNSINDLYPLLKFLSVPHFSSIEWWNSEIVRYFNIDSNHPRPTTALRMLFSSLLLRRTPQSVVNGQSILDLPSKEVILRKVALSREEMRFYSEIHANAARKLNSAQQRRFGSPNTFTTAFEMLIRCRQTCLHPYIVVAALRRYQGTSAAQAPPPEGTHTTATNATAAAIDATVKQEEVVRAMNHFIDRVLIRRMKADKAGEFLQELIRELRSHKFEERECIICMETLNGPVILPCAHTFCRSCIQHAFQLHRRCPLCKRDTRASDILEVPSNLLVSSNSVGAGGCAGGGGDDGQPSALQMSASVDVTNLDNWPAQLSAKTEYLLHALSQIPLGERVVVFSSFVTYLRYVQHCLERANVSSVMYTGQLTMKQKQVVLRHFRGEVAVAPPPRVLLATITSCGVGINLTCANHCFLMEPSWNPGTEEQALNRVHRIGQTRPVRVVKLIAQSTVEEKIEALCQSKRMLSGFCCNTQEGTAARHLRTEDLLALFVNDDSSGASSDSEDSDDE